MKNIFFSFAIMALTANIQAQTIAQQDGRSEIWTLEACIQQAWVNSLLVREGEFGLENAEIDLKLAKHSRFPSLVANSTGFVNFGRSIDPVSNQFIATTFLSNGIGLNTNVTLFNANRINNLISRTRIDKQASGRDLDQIKNNIALQVANAYINVLFASENLSNSRKQLEETAQQLEQIDKLIEFGSRPANERLDLEAQYATREQSIVNNENNLTIAYLLLKQLMRVDMNYNMVLEIPEDLEVDGDPDLYTFDEVFRSALITQKSVEAGELRVLSAEKNVEVAQAELYPSLGFTGNLQTNFSNQARIIERFETVRQETQVFINNQPVTIATDANVPILANNPYFNQLGDNVFFGFGMFLRVPIYSNYNVSGGIQRAKVNVMNTKNQLEQEKDRIRNDVQQALADARSAKRSFIAAQKSVNAQQVAYENGLRRLEVGAMNPFDVIFIQNQLEQSEINLIIAKYDYFFKMKVLDFYMGKPLSMN